MHETRRVEAKTLQRTMRVFLTNYVTEVLIGIYPDEHVHPQKMRIDIEVTMGYGTKPETIDDVLDYTQLRDGVRRIIDEGHIDFQETFCDKIASMCLSFARVSSANVKVAKLEAFSDCEAVGCQIEIERMRTDISLFELGCLPPGVGA